ncbi:MAG: ATP-binding protein, partial [Deltaproteobacteria bacterium]|nr:ATP-binding protein [Deltaproteobacteria bacterium]
IVLFAFLQRVMNGGADFIQREYALGRTRVDICVGYKGIHYPVELKIRSARNIKKGIEQLSGYMDKCGSSSGWLVVFDRDFRKPWSEKITWDIMDQEGKSIRLAGC